jgi:cytochrome c biogenesis protein
VIVREASTTTTEPSRPPAVSPRELAAWAWRQLTSMRVALILLFFLAVAAIPGSVVPQREVNPLAVADFRDRSPALAQWYERLGLFDVYSAPWFAAIYLALIVSLVGCIVPRSVQHWRASRAGPPPAPRRLSRMPAYRRFEVDAEPADVLAAARATLKSRRFRLAPPQGTVGMPADAPPEDSGPEAAGRGSGRLKSDSWDALPPRIAEPAERSASSGSRTVRAGSTQATTDSVGAEAGQLRETGNLVFHLAVVVVLVAVAVGSLFGYRATVIVPEGSGFANSLIQYDGMSSGALFDVGDLPPFSLELDEFDMEFVEAGANLGAPDDFEATVRFTPEPGAPQETRTIRVNQPLEIDGTLIHILNPGYAPLITVRDAEGNVLAEGPVPFLPQDNSFASTGVRKIPVGADVALGEDLGIQALFLPTALLDEGGPRSIFPEPRNPALFLTAFHGDLGLDDGQPQSVYQLDSEGMQQFRTEDGDVFRAALSVGETATLPDEYGSVTFDGYVNWVNFQVSRNAGKEFVLAGAVLALAGLLLSLYIRRRRVWVRVAAADQGGKLVEVAGLQRSESGDLKAEVDAIADQIDRRLRPARPEG